MKIDVAQPIGVRRERVAQALADPSWYASIVTKPGLGDPEPLSLTVIDHVVHTSVRWRYAGTLPSAASRVIDPSKLTWVIEVRLALDDFRGSVHVVPDHYEGLLACDASLFFEPSDDGCVERVSGELNVRVPLFGDAVEKAIATGFEEHLRTEADALERFCA
jgi:Protein of unknown function (DUF2505)